MTQGDLRRAIISGAVERGRPKMMAVTAIMAGLLPILWSQARDPSDPRFKENDNA